MLEGLIAAQQFTEYSQGTTNNENWHSYLAKCLLVHGGIRLFHSVKVLVEMYGLFFNRRVRANAMTALNKSVDIRSTAAGIMQFAMQTGSHSR